MNRYPFIKIMIFNYLLEREELTGYNFIKYCQEIGIPASSGTVYPHLKDLTSQGLLKYQKEEQKKIYSLTQKGKEKLESTSYTNIPTFVKNFFFKNISLAAHMDWKKAEDVERLLMSVQETQGQIERYWKELKRQETHKNIHTTPKILE